MDEIIRRDLKHIWHPCSQMKDYENFPPLIIKKARGCYLELQDGFQVIDGISSWWCKSLGHQHPRLKEALSVQLNQYEHVISAHTCQEPLIQLSEKLSQFVPTLNKVFYASDGSTAIEIALKMCLHAKQLLGEKQRNQIMALQHGYHGETSLAMSVSDLGLYRQPFEAFLTKVNFIQNIPYLHTIAESPPKNFKQNWPFIEAQLNQNAQHLCAIIVEPLVQGAAGMFMYEKEFLLALCAWCKKNHVFLILDEIMTGLGRLGTPTVAQLLNIVPDFICLSKGLTGGVLPMSAVLISEIIYQLFYDDYKRGKNFLHSNTFSGNALAAAVAVECLNVLEEENIYKKVQTQSGFLYECMKEVALKSQRLNNVRSLGFIAAADFVLEKDEQSERFGLKLAREAARLGAYIRPIGNTVYWMPPLISTKKVIKQLAEITLEALNYIK